MSVGTGMDSSYVKCRFVAQDYRSGEAMAHQVWSQVSHPSWLAWEASDSKLAAGASTAIDRAQDVVGETNGSGEQGKVKQVLVRVCRVKGWWQGPWAVLVCGWGCILAIMVSHGRMCRVYSVSAVHIIYA